MPSVLDSSLGSQQVLQVLDTCDLLPIDERGVEPPSAGAVVSEDPPTSNNWDVPRMLGQFPDLGDVSPGSLWSSFAERAIVGDVPVLGEPAHSYLFNLARLAEKALWDYNAARAHFARLSKGYVVVNVMVCTDRLEECIDATHRSYLFADAIVDGQLEPDCPSIPDAVTVELRNMKSRRKSLRRLRDAIQHYDRQLRNTAPPTTQATYLRFDEASIFVGEYSLSYLDLERLVRTIHGITTAILQPERFSS
jgi:hypothetical protein